MRLLHHGQKPKASPTGRIYVRNLNQDQKSGWQSGGVHIPPYGPCRCTGSSSPPGRRASPDACGWCRRRRTRVRPRSHRTQWPRTCRRSPLFRAGDRRVLDRPAPDHRGPASAKKCLRHHKFHEFFSHLIRDRSKGIEPGFCSARQERCTSRRSIQRAGCRPWPHAPTRTAHADDRQLFWRRSRVET